MEIDFRHQLAEDDARARLRVLGEYLGAKHGIKVSWLDDNKARFSGKYLVVRIDGELSLSSQIVRFRGEDPGFLWRRKATDYIEGKLSKYLDPKVTLADLPKA
ncbi:MAG: polyhydroxyalkanoic acid system family protein [Kofleriaceae bacterium]|jgi:hypothetical protein|nr:polyhydroxyalkanoic acid system family protein [Kofleriaceae bacterium]MBP6839527.1 polyhydroxyalkanoic acid system family protein [Kofleriaceae bacterium]MBP9203319.1 polyhydroxyalkanoic acid system family protein [Kofleriaceae bacterium]